jgi:hypothetical protein
MPVFGRGYPYGVYIFIVKNAAHVFRRTGTVAECLFYIRLRIRKFGFVDVANRFNHYILIRFATIDYTTQPARAAPNQGKHNPVVCTRNGLSVQNLTPQRHPGNAYRTGF